MASEPNEALRCEIVAKLDSLSSTDQDKLRIALLNRTVDAIEKALSATSLSQADFASAFGYSQSSLSNYLNLKASNFGAVAIPQLLDMLTFAERAPTWTQEWNAFFHRFRVDSERAQNRFVALADSPAELVFVPRAELKLLSRRGFVKHSVAQRIIDALNDWLIVVDAARLSRASLPLLRAVCDVPSKAASGSKLKALRSIGLKPASVRIVESICESLAQVERYDSDDDDDGLVDSTVESSESVEKLFSGIRLREDDDDGDDGNVVRGRSLNDALVAEEFGENHIAKLLDAVENKDRIVFIDLHNGWFTDIGPLVSRLSAFRNVTLIDMSITKVAPSQFDNLTTIASVMVERNGAVNVAGTPLASSKSADQWAAFGAAAIKDPKVLSQLLRIIWIPRDFVDDRLWLGRLGKSLATLEEAVKRAHNAFYETVPMRVQF